MHTYKWVDRDNGSQAHKQNKVTTKLSPHIKKNSSTNKPNIQKRTASPQSSRWEHQLKIAPHTYRKCINLRIYIYINLRIYIFSKENCHIQQNFPLQRHKRSKWRINEFTRIKAQRSFVVCGSERWGAGVGTQKNARGVFGGWGRVPFNEPYVPSLSTFSGGA